ncbi:hypothetical protein PENDEC_c043G05806 [Penicillium decumbens]|uniref:Zn(2)-C6 fungal-type domain-containing protein n=1 Tax=Penicillium decumbens TaxID=69771 RepID=A0A1V6NRL7_PENDC|nr:hypothetical protein PENDEC_c043G05806 [Penicillium decumbens]
MHHVHASANFSPLKPRKVRPRKSCDSSGGKLHIPLCSTLLRSTLSLYENIALDQAAVSSGRKHRLGSLCYNLAMEESRRRQLHSCDPCRKGKRGCDAPKDRKDNGFNSCSNCKRWKKECTFNWLSSKHAESKGGRRRTKPTKPSAASSTHTGGVPSIVSSYSAVLDEVLCSSQRYPANSEPPEEASNFAAPSSSPSLHQEGSVRGESEGKRVSDSQSELFCWNMSTSDDDWQNNAVKQHPEELFVDFESEEPFHDLSPGCLDHTSGTIQRFEDRSTPGFNQRRRSQREVCIASNDTASEYARSTMTQNLIRIYHDSMENALSCWLTEHNCPYSDPISDVLHYRERKEWGPSWSNRMCIRVCRLDRASAAIRGRALSAEEDRTAARALHLAIIAFASQWSQHAQKGIGLSVPAPFSHDERSIRENIWNKARHALEHSARIPSFRIIFANIIFSLTQSPLDNEEDRHLGQLLEDDNAPVFLETANRQLFIFRHKFTRLQRECPPDVRELRRGSVGSTMTDMFEMPRSSETARVDQILASYEYRSTLGLLFWLGIMFDTLSAAMYQRPLVVSDEDSQIASASTSALDSEDQVDLDGWDILRNGARKRQDVWGDFFLCHLFEHQESGQVEPRWPCSYEYAASILSEATPVKVLLYRRVTQLQTLVYRGAGHDCLEDVIQKTIMVYHRGTLYSMAIGILLRCFWRT